MKENCHSWVCVIVKVTVANHQVPTGNQRAVLNQWLYNIPQIFSDVSKTLLSTWNKTYSNLFFYSFVPGNLGNLLKYIFHCAADWIFFWPRRTKESWIEWPWGFFKDYTWFIFQSIKCLALWLECNDKTWDMLNTRDRTFGGGFESKMWVPQSDVFFSLTFLFKCH